MMSTAFQCTGSDQDHKFDNNSDINGNISCSGIEHCTRNDRIEQLTERLYNNTIILGPMVRANSLPFRLLCLNMGCHTVFSEEIIDRKLVQCKRVVNTELGTVDFVVDKTILFRTVPGLEKESLVLQLGSSTPETALQAARIVQHDVSGIDINMGCPKKFSIQAGMGAALLGTVDLACDIISTLRTHLEIPVSAKIRLLDPDTIDDNNDDANVVLNPTSDPTANPNPNPSNIVAVQEEQVVTRTADFIIALIKAGVCAVTVHCRTRHASSSENLAQHSLLRRVIERVRIYEAEIEVKGDNPYPFLKCDDATVEAGDGCNSTSSGSGFDSARPHKRIKRRIPIISNGDHYQCSAVVHHLQESGCNSVMLARPMLLNASLAVPIRRWFDEHRCHSGSSTVSNSDGDIMDTLEDTRLSGVQSQADVMRAYLRLCIRYKPLFQVAKYALQEMMVFRRHPPSIIRAIIETGLGIDKEAINPVTGGVLTKHPKFSEISRCKSLQELCNVLGGVEQEEGQYPLNDVINGVNGDNVGEDGQSCKRKIEDLSQKTSASLTATVTVTSCRRNDVSISNGLNTSNISNNKRFRLSSPSRALLIDQDGGSVQYNNTNITDTNTNTDTTTTIDSETETETKTAATGAAGACVYYTEPAHTYDDAYFADDDSTAPTAPTAH